MANDRVFIVCKTCGAWKMLLKHFPGSLGTRDNGILEWLDSHGACHPQYYNSDLQGNPGFKLATEDGLASGVLDWEKQNKVGMQE